MSAEHDDEDDYVPHHEEEHPHEEGEPWLVSYADLMTLLFGFFVLMYSFEAAKNENKQDMVAIRRELSQYFGGGYINPLDMVGEKFKEVLETLSNADPVMEEKLKNVVINIAPEGLEITFASTALFASGNASLERDAQSLIESFVEIIKETKKNFLIRVEGYTDPSPINSIQFPSNWELSASRASTVIRIFEAAGFNSERLTAVGYGSTRPAVPNYDADGNILIENFAKNRRVVIYVMQDLLEEK